MREISEGGAQLRDCLLVGASVWAIAGVKSVVGASVVFIEIAAALS